MKQVRREKLWRRLRAGDALFFVGFLCVIVFYLWKVPLEIQGYDEAFYLTIPKRLLDGDSFFIDEWHGSQLSAVFSYPLVWLHQLLFGFDGIVLHFRYVYIFFQALCAVIVYSRLRGHGLFAALAALFFFLFTPYDIMALSYNTIGLMLVTLTTVTLSTARGRTAYAVSGFLFAGAVLCCPYLLAGYLVYSIAALIVSRKAARRDIAIHWLCFTLGAVFVAAAVLLFMLSRASLPELLRAIPNLFTDPEHVSRPVWATLARYVYALFVRLSPHGGILIALYAVMLLILAGDRHRRAHQAAYLMVSGVLAAVMLADMVSAAATTSYNAIMFPLAAVGLTAYLVADKKDHRTFFLMYLGGFTYTVCIFFSSNQHVYVLTAMSTVANVGSIILLGQALSETRADATSARRLLSAAMAALLCFQFGLMVHSKALHKFWSDADNSELTQVIQEGPYQGIRVTPETEATYMEQLKLLAPLAGQEGSILYAAVNTWYYLATPQMQIGAYSAWLSAEPENTIERLSLYYAGNPAKIPDCIFIPEANNWNMALFHSRILQPYAYVPVDYDGAQVYIRSNQ